MSLSTGFMLFICEQLMRILYLSMKIISDICLEDRKMQNTGAPFSFSRPLWPCEFSYSGCSVSVRFFPFLFGLVPFVDGIMFHR